MKEKIHQLEKKCERLSNDDDKDDDKIRKLNHEIHELE